MLLKNLEYNFSTSLFAKELEINNSWLLIKYPLRLHWLVAHKIQCKFQLGCNLTVPILKSISVSGALLGSLVGTGCCDNVLVAHNKHKFQIGCSKEIGEYKIGFSFIL